MRAKWQILVDERPRSVQEVLDNLLRLRGAGPSFLNGTLKDLESHLVIRGMDAGAELMAEHLFAGRRVVLVGDYDCDGVTSLAQLSLFLQDIGYRNFDVVIPNRSEGYGIPERAVRENPDAGLFVAVDCGTLDVQPITLAVSRGSDCIVIDHHEVPESGLAPATVLINPKQASCPSAFKEFCASGLTLLFLARLRRALKGRFPVPSLGGKYLALAAIGTVADIVPLVDANRILTRSGISSINRGACPPVRYLAETAGGAGKLYTAGHLGYYVGPRINAAGRMSDARLAYDLLVASDPDETARLAQELNRLNSKRQSHEQAILDEIRRRDLPSGRRTLVMADAGWSPGVVGIVASRVQQEIHYGPTVIFAVDESKGVARGSARGIAGFDVHRALKSCDDLLLRWGGHKMAAGMTIALENLAAFEERFEEFARSYEPDIFIQRGTVDMELSLNLVGVELLEALKQFEPHGMGNPTPTFASRGVKVSLSRRFGKDQSHVRLTLDGRIEGVFWRGSRYFKEGSAGGEGLDVVFQIDWDDYRKRPVLNVKDVGNLFDA